MRSAVPRGDQQQGRAPRRPAVAAYRGDDRVDRGARLVRGLHDLSRHAAEREREHGVGGRR